MIFDRFGRPLNSLRVQVNASCNFKCFFCHMEGTDENLSQMTVEQIREVMEAARKLGIRRVKFTGGEPLLRRDFLEIVKVTKEVIGGDISVTTNGYFLKDMANKLKDSGLDRINISLHGINRESFKFVTSVDGYDRVVEGIKSAVDAGLNPVKLNMVVLKGVNDSLILDLIDFSNEVGANVQLIELEASREEEDSPWFKKFHMKLDFVEDMLRPYVDHVEFNELHNRKILVLNYKGRKMKVELVDPHRNHNFCMNCTRLRLTSTGYLQTCLHRPDQRVKVDGSDILRSFKEATDMRVPYW